MSDYEKLFWEASNLAPSNPELKLFISEFIRSLEDSSVEHSKISEFKRILDTPTGELIARMAFFTSRKI